MTARAETVLNEAHRMIVANTLEGGGYRIKKLAGDASLRKYYRVTHGAESFVLMHTEPFESSSYDFLLVHNFLERAGVPVPKMLAVEGVKGTILQEDLGDRTMLHQLAEAESPDQEIALFQESLRLLANFHSSTKKPQGEKPVPGFNLAFDEEKLMWEVDFTIEHLFGSYLKRGLTEKERESIRAPFVDITRRLAAEPRVFTHRDYHSRNLMLPESGTSHDGQLVCIDFQDARMGLRAYDLASILRDSYYQLPEEKIYSLVDYYFGLAKKEEASLDHSHFVKMFDLMSVQRNFKAIGSFTSFYGKRNDAMYIRFVGNTFENIRRNLAKFPEYKELRKLLFRYYYF
jgi:aminoglycoside/choline kinase family phosphotransferase